MIAQSSRSKRLTALPCLLGDPSTDMPATHLVLALSAKARVHRFTKVEDNRKG
ncbi:unnamed protein product [Ectocarpus sp. CCAP 1310/34]|nr:unnamed protein product [Ectocarpus sp. CCAP 1310/34]